MTMKRHYLMILLLLLPLIVCVQGRKNRNLEVAKNLDIFNEVYQNLDMLYVDTLNANEVGCERRVFQLGEVCVLRELAL